METTQSSDLEQVRIDDFPDRLGTGTTVLVASAGAATRHGVPLRLLTRFARAADSALVVSTTESATRAASRFARHWSDESRPTLGFVDTTSRSQYVSAIYEEQPVVYTPAPGDLERLVLALSDLSAVQVPADSNRHLVVRSVTPLIEATSAARVATILDRIVGLRSADGCTVLGIDYTAHDQESMSTLADCVEGVLWVTRPASDRIELEFRSTHRGPGASNRGEGRDG
ncbi:MAG: hypothetical protein V5A52_07370 [Halovenus sp.]